MANKVIDILLKATDGGAAKGIQGVAKDMLGLGDNAKGASDKTAKLDESIGHVATTGEKLKGTLEKTRLLGAALAVSGTAALALANHFTNAAIEADGLGSKMEALLRGQGLGDGAVKKVKDLAYQLALATGADDDMLASQIGEAVASGRLMSLRQYGVVVSKLGQQSITAAQGISAQAGAQEALNQLTTAMIPAVQTLRSTSSAAALAAGELDVRWGNVEETIGTGTGVIKAALYNNVLSPLLDIAEQNPDLLSTGGAVFAIGSAGAAGVGGLVSMGSQIGLMIISLNAMGITSVASFGAMATAALGAAAAIGIILLEIAAVALAAAGVMYAFDKLTHLKEDKALKENIAKGDATDDKRLEFANAQRARKGLAPLTQAEYEGDPNAADKSGANDAAAATAKFQEVANAQASGAVSLPAAPSMPAMPAMPSAAAQIAASVNNGNAPGSIDTSLLSKAAMSKGGNVGGSLTIKPKTKVTQNSAGNYVLHILPTDVVIPNDFQRAVGAL